MAQSPSLPGNQLPANPTFFDFVRFYEPQITADTSEGSFYAQIRKMNEIWESRLYPTGDASIAGSAITNYAKHFNMNGNSNCTNGNWTPIGPTGYPTGIASTKGTGQVHALKFSPNYTTDGVVYACSNWGGLWRSINGGDWEVVNTDHQLAFTSVSDIAIDPFDTDILYLTTGEAETTMGHHAQNPSGVPSLFTPLFTAGAMRSMDGGTTWEPINELNENFLCYFDNGGTIRRIHLNPNNNNQLFIATSLGIFRCDNAQAPASQIVWFYVSEEIDDLELKGLEFKPNNPQTIYASGVDIYQSTDGGNVWASMTGTGTGLHLDSLPNNFGVYRINIAVTPANPNNLYAYIVGKDDNNNRLYIYLHNGTTWQQIHTTAETNALNAITPQRTAIAVAPNNEYEIYYGTTRLRGSNNYNTNSIIDLSPYSDDNFHADVHGLAFEPGTNNLIVATDGGVHIKDRAEQNDDDGWTNFSNGLQIKTAYGLDDSENRTDRIIIGSHDTGSDIFENGNWANIQGGDGYNGKIDNKTGLAFGAYNVRRDISPTGYMIFSYDFDGSFAGGWNEYIQAVQPIDPQDASRTHVNATYDMVNHPQTEKMYFTMAELYQRQFHRQRQSGDTAEDMWYLRSNIGNFDIPQWRRKQMTQLDICEENPDWMLMSMSGTVVDAATNQQPTTFVAEPQLFLSTTGGCEGVPDFMNVCWDSLTQNLINSGVVNTSYQAQHPDNSSSIIPIITGIAFDPENHLKAWVCFTGYEPTAKVWKTIDGGQTWINDDPNQSIFNLPINDMVYQKGTNDMIYLASDAGVFYKDASMTDWKKYCDFPNVRVMELKINYCMGKIRAATFGRSVWEGDLQPSDGTIGTTELLINEDVTWDFDRGLDKNLRIAAGNTLKIEGTASQAVTFSMPKDGQITIERGAKLEVTHAKITNNCGRMWRGITVLGDPNLAQTPANQGMVVLNNAEIEYAQNAFALNLNGFGDSGGGIIQATQSSFRNNKRSAEFFPYPNNNISFFNHCSFILDDDYRSNSFIGHITLWQVKGLHFSYCTFENTNSNFVQQFDGLFSISSNFIIEGSSFAGFQHGIQATNGSNTTFSVTNTEFFNNQKGILATEVNNISLVDLNVHDNTSGVDLGDSHAIIECSDFYNNASYGVAYGEILLVLQTAPPSIATDCWWGDASGPIHGSNPTGMGDRVTDNIVFSPWSNTPSTSCSQLPLEWLYFRGQTQADQSVLLTWQVAQEEDIGHYIVERSLDAQQWQSIQRVKSQANAHFNATYECKDANLPFAHLPKALFYRLKIINTKGQLDSYSKVISVDISSLFNISMWYDQKGQQLSIVGDYSIFEASFHLWIFSVDGRLLRQYSLRDLPATHTRLDIPLHDLESGVYVAHLQTGQGKVVKKLVVW